MPASDRPASSWQSILLLGVVGLAVAVAVILALRSGSEPTGRGPGSPTGEPMNVLVVVLDDVGADMVRAYPGSKDDIHTPTLDRLASKGIRFDSAYATPVCSPTRATLLTGRYGCRTLVGDIITVYAPNSESGPQSTLEDSELTLAEQLKASDEMPVMTGAFGKAHLNDLEDDLFLAPNLRLGFDRYSGHVGNIGDTSSWEDPSNPYASVQETYHNWLHVVDGAQTPTTDYATTRTTLDAAAWIPNQPGGTRWFGYVAYHSPHLPYHVAPPELHTYTAQQLGATPTPRQMYLTMLESVDTELGKLLDSIHFWERRDVTLIVMGDNGTPPAISGDRRGKGTLYEPGIRVPLIVCGGAVPAPGVCTRLVQSVDVFATVLALMGLQPDSSRTIDGKSFSPYLTAPGAAPIRQYVFSEQFNPAGFTGSTSGEKSQRVVRDVRFKLIRTEDSTGAFTEEFYDLKADPGEQKDLLPTWKGTKDPRQADHARLQAEMDAILASAKSG